MLSSVQQCCITDNGAYIQYFMIILVFNMCMLDWFQVYFFNE